MPGRTVSTKVSLLTPSIPSGSLSAAVPGAVPTNVNGVVVIGERLPEGGLVALLRNGKAKTARLTRRIGRCQGGDEFLVGIFIGVCGSKSVAFMAADISFGSGNLRGRLLGNLLSRCDHWTERCSTAHLSARALIRSEEHTSELQSRENLVC